MIYLNPNDDSLLKTKIELILPIAYWKTHTVKQVQLEPLQLCNVKAFHVAIPAITPDKLIDNETVGGCLIGTSILTSASTDGKYDVHTCEIPDDDIVDKILRMFAYLAEQNYNGANLMINQISTETKNVIQENNLQVRLHPESRISVRPFEL